jgi:hypothetical protein
MPTAGGPNTLGESNLVFAYDTGDVKNSFRGQPTTNYLTTALTPNSATKESFSGTITENSEIAPDGTLTAHRYQVNSGYNYQVLTIPANTTITYSVWIKMLNGVTSTSFGPYIWNYNSPTYGIVAQDLSGVSPQWKRMTMTYTTQAHQSGFSLSYGATNGGMNGTYALWRPQLEYKSNATPFTTGTRSATQGLLPLIGNTSLDLSTVSFDSNAQIIFDGSDDRILTSENIVLNGSQTFETITTISGGPQSPAGIISNHDYENTSNFGLNHISNNKIGISIGYTDGTREYDSKYTTYAATVGTPFHLMMTFDQPSNTVKLYINGTLDSTFVLTKTVKFTSRPVVLGRWDYQYNYYYFNGKIPVAKIYNRALTAQEVRQNYQQKKTRFNLS